MVYGSAEGFGLNEIDLILTVSHRSVHRLSELIHFHRVDLQQLCQFADSGQRGPPLASLNSSNRLLRYPSSPGQPPYGVQFSDPQLPQSHNLRSPCDDAVYLQRSQITRHAFTARLLTIAEICGIVAVYTGWYRTEEF